MPIYRRPLNLIRKALTFQRLPEIAKTELKKDQSGLCAHDPEITDVVSASVEWLGRAQDYSQSNDGGVARDYSLLTGWNTSYPETTGYIIPTLLDYSKLTGDRAVQQRAIRMLDWLVSIQFPEGGFQGSVIGAIPVVPVTFNTGQILLGLAKGASDVGEKYREPMSRAADWLVATQDKDGCWRKNPSPFAEPGEKTYETHVSWGLFEAARVSPNSNYADAAIANVNWALQRQQPNGWIQDCCLSEPLRPLTHTLGYALRGFLEAYLFTSDAKLLEACRRTADGIVSAIKPHGFLPGRIDSDWRGTVPWACLTGSVQIAYCLLVLFMKTGDTKYRDNGYSLNSYVRRSVSLDGSLDTRGAVKGSFPISGEYCSFGFPNWASKFFVDSNLLESDVRKADS